METKQYTPWSALNYSTYMENVGVIFNACKEAGLESIWLYILAHLHLETAGFSRFTAPWNYGNIKYFSWIPTGVVYFVQYNDDDPTDRFHAFDTPENGIKAYLSLIKGSRYKVNGTEVSAQEFAQKLKSKGYATSTTFVNSVSAAYNQIIRNNPSLLSWSSGSTPQNTPQLPTKSTNKLGLFAFFLIGLTFIKQK